MSLTPESGAKLAQQMARNSAGLYRTASFKYGSLLAEYTEDFPKSFALGHLARVNPELEPAPVPTADRRRGFMFAPVTVLASIGVKWENLDDTTTCAYVWGYDVNFHGRQLYNQQGSLFSSPNVDFWRTIYLRHVVGSTPFDVIWAARDRTSETVYEGLLYAVNNLKRSIPGWSLVRLKRTVFVDCAYSYELARQGGQFLAEGYGRFPVLKKNNLVEVFQ